MNDIYRWIKHNRSQRLGELMRTLKWKLVGFANYFGLPDNSRSLSRLYAHVIRSLFKWVNRRSQPRSYNWAGLKEMLSYFGIQLLRVWKCSHVAVDWY
jgi:RNA-directed DNA polymerase